MKSPDKGKDVKLYCLGCSNVVVNNFQGGTLAISCSCGAYSPFLVNDFGRVVAEPSSFALYQVGGPHIEYYLGYSDHKSDAKTAMVRVMREKGMISQSECVQPACQEQYRKKSVNGN